MKRMSVSPGMLRIASKCHSGKIDSRMSRSKWENWLAGVLGVEVI